MSTTTFQYQYLSDASTNLLELLQQQNANGVTYAKASGSEPYDVLAAKTIINIQSTIPPAIPYTNYAGLRAFSFDATTVGSQIYFTNGYSVVGDGGDGFWYWDGSSTAADNDGTILKPDSISSGPGRYKRVCDQTNLRADWFGRDGDCIWKAITALTTFGAGRGKLVLSNYSYKSPTFYDVTRRVSLNNFQLQGEAISSWSTDRLVGGSIMMGPFFVFANNHTVDSVGVDSGPYVCTTYFGGVSQEGYNFASASQSGLCNNLKVNNLIGLCVDGSSFHPVLLEGAVGCTATNVTGVGGLYGVVFKTQRTNASNLRGINNANHAVLLKSDSYANVTNVNISGIVAENSLGWSDNIGVSVWAATATAAGINISDVVISGCITGVHLREFSTFANTDINLSNIKIDSGATTGLKLQGRRIVLDGAIINNVTDGILTFSPEAKNQTILDNIDITNATTGITWDNPICVGSASFNNVVTAFVSSSNLPIKVGRAAYFSVTHRFAGDVPTLLNGWVAFPVGGNSPIILDVSGGGVRLSGLLYGASETGAQLFTLPQFLWPATNLRLALAVSAGGVFKGSQVTIGTDGHVTLDDPASAAFTASLDGLTYPL